MSWIRCLTITSILAFSSSSFAQAPSITNKDITFSKQVTFESAQWISKAGVLLEDAKSFWQASADGTKYTLLAGGPGIFVLRFKNDSSNLAYVLQYDGNSLSSVSPNSTTAPPIAPTVNLNLSASSTPSAAAAAADAGLNLKDQVKNWVLEVAKTWGSTGSGRENYVQRFDRTPAATSESIAKIFEETAATLKTDTDLATAKELLKRQLQVFYDSQKKPLRTINPITEDWQPFLQYLDENLASKFPAIQLSNSNHARFVLLELAAAFRELRSYFLDEQSGTGQVGATAGTGGGTILGNSGYSGTHCRKRRCQCASLLFGY